MLVIFNQEHNEPCTSYGGLSRGVANKSLQEENMLLGFLDVVEPRHQWSAATLRAAVTSEHTVVCSGTSCPVQDLVVEGETVEFSDIRGFTSPERYFRFSVREGEGAPFLAVPVNVRWSFAFVADRQKLTVKNAPMPSRVAGRVRTLPEGIGQQLDEPFRMRMALANHANVFVTIAPDDVLGETKPESVARALLDKGCRTLEDLVKLLSTP